MTQIMLSIITIKKEVLKEVHLLFHSKSRKKLLMILEKMAVPQAKAQSYPDRPEIADPTKSKGAFGLPANYIEKLEKGAVKGTGKVETP